MTGAITLAQCPAILTLAIGVPLCELAHAAHQRDGVTPLLLHNMPRKSAALLFLQVTSSLNTVLPQKPRLSYSLSPPSPF
jgi:hypothetical protein